MIVHNSSWRKRAVNALRGRSVRTACAAVFALSVSLVGCSEGSIDRTEPAGQLLLGIAETDVRPVDARSLVGTLDVASGVHELLPLEADHIFSARWRPDGRAVLVEAVADIDMAYKAPSIYVASMDDLSLVAVKGATHDDSAPDWGPTCDSIVMRRHSSLWQLGIDGSAATELVDLGGILMTPDWSGDGSRLTFRRQVAGVSEIWVAGPDGTDLVLIVSEADGQGNQPRVSPTGDHVAFIRSVEHEIGHMRSQLFVHDLVEGEARQLTDGPDGVYETVWSPDGEWIAFSDDYSRIHLIRLDGSDRRTLEERGTLFDWGPVTGACAASPVT